MENSEQKKGGPNLSCLLMQHLQQLVPLVQWVSLSLGVPRAWLTVKGRDRAFKISSNGTIQEHLNPEFPLYFQLQEVVRNKSGANLQISNFLDCEPAREQSSHLCGWAISIEPLGATASIGLAHDSEIALDVRADGIIRLANASIRNCLAQLFELASKEPLSLRATQAKLNLALAAGHIGIVEYDFNSRHIAFDVQLGQLYGYQKAVRGPTEQLWMNRLHPEDLTQAVATLRTAVPDADGRALIDTEYRIISLDGTERDLQAKGMIQFNAQGKPDHLIGAQWDVTEHKQNLRTLSSRNDQLQDAYDYIELAKNGVGIGVGDYDVRKGVLSYDTITAGLFGLPSPMSNTTYADWAKMLAPDVLQRVVAESMPVLKDPTRHDVRLQYPIVTKDGRRRELQWVYRIFRDQKGHATRLLGCVWDVTQEAENRRSLERMQSMLLEMERLGNIGAWAYDPETGLIDWTGQIHRIVASELKGPIKLEEATRYYLPDSRRQILAAFREAIENGNGWDLVLELETEEKVLKWVHSRGKAIQKTDGTIARLIGSVRDVTLEVKEKKERLRQHEQLQSCLDKMQLGILVFTQNKLVFANAAFRKTIGLETDEALDGMSPFALTHRKDHKFLARRYATTLKGESPVSPLVIDILARDGSATSCLTAISPITWDGELNMLASIAPLREAEMVRTVIRATQDRYDRQLVKKIEELQSNVARELHDLVGSKLAGVSIVIAGLASRSPSMRQELLLAYTHLQDAAVSTRSLARGLMPVDNVPGSFWRALEQTCHEYNSATDVRCTFAMRGQFDDIDPQVGGHLYRIALEAMSNAMIHGKAKAMTVNLKRRGVYCVMEVVDYGRGMDAKALANSTGIGMRSMRARALEIGGVFRFEPNPDGGVRVIVKWSSQKSSG